MSFLAGLVTVHGGACFLEDDRRSSMQIRVTHFGRKTTTIARIDEALLQRRISTSRHFGQNLWVVATVEYGANLVASFDYDAGNESRLQDVGGHLEILVQSIPGLEIGGSGSIQVEDYWESRRRRLTFSWNGDVLLDRVPTTLEEVVEAIHNFNANLANVNGGRGIPLYVTLEPVCQ